MSLRLKLLIAVIVLAFAGLLASDIVTYTSLRSFLFDRVDQQLQAAVPPALHEIQEAGGPFQAPGGPSSFLPRGTYAQLRDASGHLIVPPLRKTYGVAARPDPLLPSNLPQPSASGTKPVLLTVGAMGGGSLRYRVSINLVQNDQGDRGTLVVAIPLSDVDQTLGRLRIIEGLVSGGVVVALGLLLWWLVRRELRPLEEIGVTAGAIAAGDLARRVEPTDERTEIGRLGVALNSMLAQIEAAFDERRASEARLRRFVADASHELRTPLTSIRGYAELFRRGADSRPEDLAKSMRRIEAEASRMGLLVDDLLLLARLDQGRPLEQEPVDVARVVSDAADSAKAIEPDRPISVDADGPAMVVGDEGRLRQVVDNLLDNVRVHTQPGTPVQVKVEANAEEVSLSIADDGPGLSSGVAARVFERFYRGDPARSRVTGGVGLGLSIVSAIVEAHGGTVSASSRAGSGAMFHVRLPTAAATDAAPSTGSQTDAAPSTGSQTDAASPSDAPEARAATGAEPVGDAPVAAVSEEERTKA